jgi:hypothetical protein
MALPHGPNIDKVPLLQRFGHGSDNSARTKRYRELQHCWRFTARVPADTSTSQRDPRQYASSGTLWIAGQGRA